MVEEIFEIHIFFKCFILNQNNTWFLHHGWRKFWNLVLPNAWNWPQSLIKNVIDSEQIGFTHSRRKELNFMHAHRKKKPFTHHACKWFHAFTQNIFELHAEKKALYAITHAHGGLVLNKHFDFPEFPNDISSHPESQTKSFWGIPEQIFRFSRIHERYFFFSRIPN